MSDTMILRKIVEKWSMGWVITYHDPELHTIDVCVFEEEDEYRFSGTIWTDLCSHFQSFIRECSIDYVRRSFT